ncbi:hypothetical protein IQ235_04080 [Oscillatoriales cyanobacterium LEGE 11467]|uniref:Diguanylate cyclase n=1 Tax=Zarconia navalis LEGE 11467 TaxID=1828826 RepID=A0A928Z6X5_9CYAN|nr:hypothetical protein [Zarconia navalis]MBE9039970.1 hypothetical protein [Zarconia navalis LEGE 11467]
MRKPTQYKRFCCQKPSISTQSSDPDRLLVRDRQNPQNASQIPPFNVALDRAWHQAACERKVLSVLLIKIEYCPHRKASWEFRTKEQLCQQITRILRGNLYNAEARIFRYAHRRFACILPQINASEVQSICHLLPITLRAIGLVPVMGATAVQPALMDADPDFLAQASEAAIYQASQKKSLCCVLNATQPQLLARTVYAKLSQMPNRDRVWIKLSSRTLKLEKHQRVATLAGECKTG